nr:hypothetical protein 17 [Bacillaceae bacterium]
MFNKIKELFVEYGWKKVVFGSIALVIGIVGLTISLTLALLFIMQKYDDRYIESEEGKLEMKGQLEEIQKEENAD